MMTSEEIRFLGLPPAVWWRYATIAEGRGITVRELLVELTAQPTPVVSQLEVLTRELSAARAAGFRVPTRNTGSVRMWEVEQRRRDNLGSFRRMKTEWTI